jgi:ADP-ribose pyrophosphatase YjhB (NUDIX family)
LGERAADAALRELREETGVEADVVGFAGYREMMTRSDRGATWRHFVILAFAARWRTGDATAGAELAALQWMEPSTLDKFETTDGLAEIVEAARRLVEG